MVKKKKVKKDSEKVCETFKTNKGKTVKTCGVLPKKHATKKQLREQNKLLRNILIIIVALFVVTAGSYFYFASLSEIKYEGMKFDVINTGSVVFYHTSFPYYRNGIEIGDYNVYLRNHPKKLDRKVDFNGEMNLKDLLIIESEEAFVCDGTGAISVANIVQIFEAVGIEVGQDPEAECDEQGRYMFIRLQNSDKTSVEQVGPACYNLNINDCEILEVTERFILETLKQIG